MKLINTALQRFFTVKYKGKVYYVNYLNSEKVMYSMFNRLDWEIVDEDREELDIYEFKDTTKKQKEQIKKNIELQDKLIDFCIKHFNDYRPEL